MFEKLHYIEKGMDMFELCHALSPDFVGSSPKGRAENFPYAPEFLTFFALLAERSESSRPMGVGADLGEVRKCRKTKIFPL